MPVLAETLDMQERASKTIKVSSKRQITIPANMYARFNFSDYALITETDDGLLIQPLPVSDDQASIDVLRFLIDQGLEGDELINKYAEIIPKVVSMRDAIARSEADVEAGRIDTVDNMQNRMREKYNV